MSTLLRANKSMINVCKIFLNKKYEIVVSDLYETTQLFNSIGCRNGEARTCYFKSKALYLRKNLVIDKFEYLTFLNIE
jgi:hypothetical protein